MWRQFYKNCFTGLYSWDLNMYVCKSFCVVSRVVMRYQFEYHLNFMAIYIDFESSFGLRHVRKVFWALFGKQDKKSLPKIIADELFKFTANLVSQSLEQLQIQYSNILEGRNCGCLSVRGYLISIGCDISFFFNLNQILILHIVYWKPLWKHVVP